MKLFKAPGGGAFATTVLNRLYPVREGVFAVIDQTAIAQLLEQGFEEAHGVADEIIAELVQLGSTYIDPVEEAVGGAAAAAAGAGVNLAPLQEMIRAAHDRIDEVEKRVDDLAATVTEKVGGEAGDRTADADADGHDGGEKAAVDVAALTARIEAADGHEALNELAAELGVDGYQAKKPGVDAKKKALAEKVAELAAAQPASEQPAE